MPHCALIQFRLKENTAELQSPKLFSVDSHETKYLISRNLASSPTSSVFREHCLASSLTVLVYVCHLGNKSSLTSDRHENQALVISGMPVCSERLAFLESEC